MKKKSFLLMLLLLLLLLLLLWEFFPRPQMREKEDMCCYERVGGKLSHISKAHTTTLVQQISSCG